jgi:hypothetical protein
MTYPLLHRDDNIHRSVSDSAGDWEYAERSVRDIACVGFLFSRLA